MFSAICNQEPWHERQNMHGIQLRIEVDTIIISSNSIGFETGSHQTGHELVIFLPKPPECRNYGLSHHAWLRTYHLNENLQIISKEIFSDYFQPFVLYIVIYYQVIIFLIYFSQSRHVSYLTVEPIRIQDIHSLIFKENLGSIKLSSFRHKILISQIHVLPLSVPWLCKNNLSSLNLIFLICKKEVPII
jgi:hypothetical protein